MCDERGVTKWGESLTASVLRAKRVRRRPPCPCTLTPLTYRIASQFFCMVTGGRKPPANLGGGGKLGAKTDGASIPPPTGQSVVQARNAKKTALDEVMRCIR